jgi:hypothetical protein
MVGATEFESVKEGMCAGEAVEGSTVTVGTSVTAHSPY